MSWLRWYDSKGWAMLFYPPFIAYSDGQKSLLIPAYKANLLYLQIGRPQEIGKNPDAFLQGYLYSAYIHSL